MNHKRGGPQRSQQHRNNSHPLVEAEICRMTAAKPRLDGCKDRHRKRKRDRDEERNTTIKHNSFMIGISY